MKTDIRRHGDVMIKQRKDFKPPTGLKWKPCKILFKGANHNHFFSKGEVVTAYKKDPKNPFLMCYIKVKKDALISHGSKGDSDHPTKPVPKGNYWVEIQTEKDHIKNIKRAVID